MAATGDSSQTQLILSTINPGTRIQMLVRMEMLVEMGEGTVNMCPAVPFAVLVPIPDVHSWSSCFRGDADKMSSFGYRNSYAKITDVAYSDEGCRDIQWDIDQLRRHWQTLFNPIGESEQLPSSPVTLEPWFGLVGLGVGAFG